MTDQYAIVVSQFNEGITSKLLQGALDEFTKAGVMQVKVVQVPGAVEIPLTAQVLAKTKQFQAIVCLGAVIRGDTSHYDYVCEQVSQGCQKVMLDHNLPIIFGILTTENETQALERVGGKEGHKGHEAAKTALSMVATLKTL